MHYALTSANDAAERDPKDWTLKGSHDGKNWTVLDTQTDQSFDERFQTKVYQFPNPTAYPHYRLDITENNGGDIIQLAEIQLSDGDTPRPRPPTCESLVGDGPSSALHRQDPASASPA